MQWRVFIVRWRLEDRKTSLEFLLCNWVACTTLLNHVFPLCVHVRVAMYHLISCSPYGFLQRYHSLFKGDIRITSMKDEFVLADVDIIVWKGSRIIYICRRRCLAKEFAWVCDFTKTTLSWETIFLMIWVNVWSHLLIFFRVFVQQFGRVWNGFGLLPWNGPLMEVIPSLLHLLFLGQVFWRTLPLCSRSGNIPTRIILITANLWCCLWPWDTWNLG